MSMDEEILKRLRARVLYSSSFSGEGHIPTSFSILEIIYSYYAIQKKSMTLFSKVLIKSFCRRAMLQLGSMQS